MPISLRSGFEAASAIELIISPFIDSSIEGKSNER